MGKDTIQLDDAVSTISGEYLLEFTSEYGIPEDLHPEFPGPEDTIVDFSKGKVEMELFNLISAPNPAKVKTETRPRVAHEVPLLTATANRVIDMEDTTGESGSSRTPSTMEKSPLDFADEDLPPPNTEGVGTEEQIQDEEAADIGPLVHKRHRKRGNDEADANAPPKVLRKYHVAFRPAQSTIGGKSLATMGKATSSTITPAAQDTPAGESSVKDPDPLSYAKPRPIPEQDIAQSSRGTATEIPTEHVATTEVNVQLSAGSPESGKSTSIPSVVGSPGASGTGLPTEVEIEAKEKPIKNIEALLEDEADMKKAAEAKNAELMKDLEGLRGHFSDLQLSNQQLLQQVSTLQAQVTSDEKIKAAFEEFKKYEDDRVEQRCAEMDARLDKLSVDFDEELYPHMLTAIAGHRWVIRHDLRMSKGLEHDIEHGKAGRDLEAVEAYDPEAHSKYLKALQKLKDLKYPDLRPNISQLKIPAYPEVRDPRNPWAIKEEILLEDAIAANVSHTKKKKKFWVVCRTHRVGFAHHATSDGVSVSTPTVAPQGLAILLADAYTQTEISKGEASSRLLRSMSLPAMYNLDWP
ncbi:hypothetical protein Tco_0962387 [Tanacetum coccineum]